MSDPSGGQEDLASEIFSDVEYSPTQPELKEFKPWHKPRKQFVRRKQLSKLLRRIYRQREPSAPLRYLGLPGTDLIDLRYLHEELCRADNRPLRFLGFNTEAQPGNPAHIELSVSLDEVRRLPDVDPLSEVIHTDFRQIGNEESIAWSRVQKLGPFDVINIDLCDGLASDPPQNDASIYHALSRVMALQARNHTPWLLFIATRIGRGEFDADAEETLIRRFRKNVSECEGFADACNRILQSDASSIDPATCSPTDLLHLMTVAIGKWLSAMMQVQGTSRLELASVHGYQVNPDSPCEDLVSLALRFQPVIKASPDPLSPAPPDPLDECEIAKSILRRSTNRINVDEVLYDDRKLHDELIGETQELLAKARYDVTGYRSWLQR
ncbi:PP_RS20740 family protein [Candidatus Poriferisocius sp.]|uniref:PP_RS20740 family protein n=1 Tax=Candidatus Poriferisocius sp. TaxID=3101276 RepID=UPI003B012919